MASKLTLNDIASLASQTSAIATLNGNNGLIEAAFDNTLSRDGSGPNQMGAPLDMNGFTIINVAQGVNPGDIARIGDLKAGPQGPTGPTGLSVRTGTGVPSGGNSGDSYIDLATFNFYTNSGGVWTLQGNIKGPTGSGSGDMLRANNLSDVTAVATARSNLGLAIGTNVQAFNATLAALAALAGAANKIAYFTGANTLAVTDFTAQGIALVGGSTAAAQRTTLGLGSSAVANIGTTAGSVAAGNDIRFYNTNITIQDTNYNFALADRGKMVRHTSGSTHAWTLQPQSVTSYGAGDSFLLRNAVAGGVVTITRGTGVNLYKAGSITSQDVQLAAGGMATVFLEDSDTWVISGTGLT